MTSHSKFGDTFDGISSRTIFCLWTGEELMSENRLRALWSIFKAVGRPVAFITQETVSQWILPEHPIHPAYPYLTSTHKADYLRCYLMHHYGGGYTDIKATQQAWEPFFTQLECAQEKLALGYAEIENGIPHIQGEQGDLLRASHQELIGLCAFIFKKQTQLTQAWYDQLHHVLSEKFEMLQAHPGVCSLDQNGIILPDGSKSEYPLRWAEILGEILHPLMYHYRHQLIKTSIAPSFAEYR